MIGEDIKFDEMGLVPVIVQDAQNGQVLMFAYANLEALEKTIQTGKAHFWSRSRQKLWQKGEESGNVQDVVGVYIDCDNDCILVTVDQRGVACHTGNRSCFYRDLKTLKHEAPTFGTSKGIKTLSDVYNVILDRKRNPREGSYVRKLFEGGIDRILKKVGEEAGEVIIASKNEDLGEIKYELTDLFFHSLVAMAYFDITPEEISKEFQKRFGKRKEEYSAAE